MIDKRFDRSFAIFIAKAVCGLREEEKGQNETQDISIHFSVDGNGTKQS